MLLYINLQRDHDHRQLPLWVSLFCLAILAAGLVLFALGVIGARPRGRGL